jgi:PA14 domain/Dolichyl-phosphate-mannose-protein mannosyltransferase
MTGRVLVGLLACSFVFYTANRLFTGPSGLHAIYFDGPDWQPGAGTTSYIDNPPSTALLKARRPDFERRAFSVEWRGFIAAPVSGTYTFRTVSDDGSWVYVRGREVVANGGIHGPREAHGTIELPAGVHSIFVRYFQDKEDCAFELSWSRRGSAFEPVPTWALLAERTSPARVLAAYLTRVAVIVLGIVWYVLVATIVLLWIVRTGRRVVEFGPGAIDPAIVSVVLISVALDVWGIWWGMPNIRGWAPDEVVPADVRAALHAWFSNGWHEKYPPFHYAVLAAADSPVLILSRLGVLDIDATAAHVALVLIGRFVSVAFAAATIVVIYRCGLEIYGKRGATLAALTAALTLPFTYHAKIANVDVPYLFWFTVSLLAYIRILRRRARRDYVLFAVAAALAGCTKDQAWAAYLLTPIAIAIARWRSRPVGGSRVDVIVDRTVLIAVAAGAATFLIADNVLLNFSGFASHVRTLLDAPVAYREFPPTVAGQLHLAWRVVQELRLMFGWPLSIIVAIAAIRAFAGATAPALRWLVALPLSYYIVFIGGILYFYDRFLLPITLVLSLYAGGWLAAFLAPQVRARAVRVAIVSAAFVYTIVYVAGVDYAMTFDSRYAVARWLHAHVRPGMIVGSLGPLEYQTIADGFAWQSVESVDDVRRIQPTYIVLNADQPQFLAPPIRDMHEALIGGRVGYRVAATFRTAPWPLPGLHRDLGPDPRYGREYSDLVAIDPTMVIFERIDGPTR